MATVKTAISLHQSLFEQVEAVARDLSISRSQVIALALEEYFRHRQNQHLLDALNQAYDPSSEPDQRERAAELRQQHRWMVEGEW